jgi:hypothetical protein
MSTIYGAIGIDEYQADQVYLQTIGYELIYEATQAWTAQYNADLDAALAIFVDRTTDQHSFRYKLPATGRLQRRGGQARSAAAKAAGKWDVAFPLEDFGDVVAGDDIALAYMTAAEYQRHLDGVQNRNTGTVRFELLKALLNNTARTFTDETLNSPTLTIQPLANGDSVVYPPVLGSESEATEDHYIETGYAAASISDTNNPYVTGRDELEEHFGATQGGSNIVSFINNAQTAKTEALSDFSEVPDRFVQVGADTDYAISLPAGLPGERIVGRTNGVWVVEWRWIPANYMLFLHLDAPKPLIKRIDPSATGLGQGLQLVASSMDNPIESAFWRHRFGFGVGNRLNGVVLELGTGGTYTIPTGYS